MSEVQWTRAVERTESVSFLDLVFLGTASEYFKQYVGMDLPYRSNMYLDGVVYMNPSDIQEASQAIAQVAASDPEVYIRFAARCYEQCNYLLDKSKEIGNL